MRARIHQQPLAVGRPVRRFPNLVCREDDAAGFRGDIVDRDLAAILGLLSAPLSENRGRGEQKSNERFHFLRIVAPLRSGEPVKSWNLIEKALTPDGKELTLHEHDGSYYIRLDGQPLMSTRQHTSEEKLGELACAHVKGKRAARVLIGGLGFGFTLRAALAVLAPDAAVVVAELLAQVIEWNRNSALPLASDAIADPRVRVVQQDVGELIRVARHKFDSIILDVDNGPAPLSAPRNRRLYELAGLQQMRAALRPGGCVAFWSAGPDAAFADLMARAGFTVEIQRARARGHSGATHTIFVGRAI